MTHGIDPFVPGGTYFFTLRLRDPRADLLIRRISLLRDVVRLCRQQVPFIIDAAVVLPAHLHMIWVLPDMDRDYASRWRMIRSSFARHLPVPGTGPDPDHRRTGVWQRRFCAHAICDDGDLALHRHLIATAPVRAGLVRRIGDWPFGSWHPQQGDAVTSRTAVAAPATPDRWRQKRG